MKLKAGICDADKRPITIEDMDALIEFLPLFEHTSFDFGELVGFKKKDANTYEMPHGILSNTSLEFHRQLYEHGWIIGFEWGWSFAEPYMNQPEKLQTADLLTLRKLLTTHARLERFCEGHFVSVLKSGHITAILRRVRELRKEMAGRDIWDEPRE